MGMGQIDCGVGDIATDHILAKVANAGPGIKDQNLIANPHFEATGVAAIHNMVR